MTETMTYLSLNSATAPKTGRNGGAVAYRILTDATTRQEVYFMITENIGAGGYFSSEPVAFSKVEACFKDMEAGKPFPAKIFRSAFVSKSSNNYGFLGAVLRTEKLLSPVPDAIHQHLRSGDWAAWRTAMLAKEGEPYVPPVPGSANGQAQPAQARTSQAAIESPRKQGKQKTPSKNPLAHSVAEANDADRA